MRIGRYLPVMCAWVLCVPRQNQQTMARYPNDQAGGVKWITCCIVISNSYNRSHPNDVSIVAIGHRRGGRCRHTHIRLTQTHRKGTNHHSHTHTHTVNILGVTEIVHTRISENWTVYQRFDPEALMRGHKPRSMQQTKQQQQKCSR